MKSPIHNFEYYERCPDLIFGLAGPIGVDMKYVEQTLCDSLHAFNYKTHEIRLTKIMQDLKCSQNVDDSTLFRAYTTKMDYANDLRQNYGNDILAALAISAIRQAREESFSRDSVTGKAFIIRQLKTPEEVRLLRSVYGKQFIQISIHGTEDLTGC